MNIDTESVIIAAPMVFSPTEGLAIFLLIFYFEILFIHITTSKLQFLLDLHLMY